MNCKAIAHKYYDLKLNAHSRKRNLMETMLQISQVDLTDFPTATKSYEVGFPGIQLDHL